VFRASLHSSSGEQTVLHCIWLSALAIAGCSLGESGSRLCALSKHVETKLIANKSQLLHVIGLAFHLLIKDAQSNEHLKK
jgi:hypothetical protein